jgi:threonine/homoserine/homoserine lactone efflux protein
LTNGLFTHLTIGLVVSFIGSVPPGAINLTAIKISLDKGYRAVVSFALAAALVEFVYGLIAVYCSSFFLSHQGLNALFEKITVVVFLVMGVCYFFQRSTPDTRSGGKGSGSFAKGIMLSIFNPLGIPFWLAYTSFLQVRQWIYLDPFTTLFYAFGIAAGAFAALILFGLLGRRINDNLQLSTKVINRIVGSVLVLLAVSKWISG